MFRLTDCFSTFVLRNEQDNLFEMKILWLVVLLVWFSTQAMSQQQNLKVTEKVVIDGKEYLLHQVVQGETLFSICKKYQVEQKDLVTANPQLINGLKNGDRLRIPFQAEDKKLKPLETTDSKSVKFIYHVVKKSETVYSISKLYNVPVQQIYKYNPESEKELLVNEILRIPQQNELNENVKLKTDDTGFFYHKIEPGETFYAYERKYGVSKEMLIKLNPELSEGLTTGLTIKIPSAQMPKTDETPVQPEMLLTHVVKQGETMYSISKRYNVKIIDIKELNPDLRTRGLISGETIYLSKSDENKVEKLKPGAEIQLTKESADQKKEEVVSPEISYPNQPKKKSDCKTRSSYSAKDTFRISMFLPLFYDRNDQLNLDYKSEKEIAYLDSMKSIDPMILKKYFKIEYDPNTRQRDTILIDSLGIMQVRELFPATKSILSFYEGVLIAIDSMHNAGVNVRLDLFDTQNSLKKINKILNQHDFINTDLIIGPIDTAMQQSVSGYSAKNHIPMVSPFFTSDKYLDNNPYYFQVSPSKEYLMRKTSDFISDHYYNKNFIIMTLGSYTQLKDYDLIKMVREKFFSKGSSLHLDKIHFTKLDFTEGGTTGYWQIKNNLRDDIENVIFIPATDNRNEREALLSRAINSLNVLAGEYDITLIGVSDYPRFRSINTEYYHRLKLHYLTPNYIDYNSDQVNAFVKKYRTNFSAEPDMLSFRGFDLITYFVSAYHNYGKNYLGCLPQYEIPLLQNDFNFQKVNELGGYMNHSLYIMNYTSDYNIKVISEISEGRSSVRK